MATEPRSLQANLGFRRTVQLIDLQSLEHTVQSMWITIIVSWFRPEDGYHWTFKCSTDINMPNISVIRLRSTGRISYDLEHPNERRVMLVQCRRPALDAPREWEETIAGLSENLSSTERLFGAVAIGKKVRFYRLDGGEQPDRKVVQLLRGTIDLSTGEGLAEVERMLNYVKAHGWQWARDPDD